MGCVILIRKHLHNGLITQPHEFIQINVQLPPSLGGRISRVVYDIPGDLGSLGQQDLAHDPRQDPKGLIIRWLTVG
jgi:hypothetical protein